MTLDSALVDQIGAALGTAIGVGTVYDRIIGNRLKQIENAILSGDKQSLDAALVQVSALRAEMDEVDHRVKVLETDLAELRSEARLRHQALESLTKTLNAITRVSLVME